MEASAAPAAQERSHYQRLETLGDTVLKYTVSIQLLSAHPLWHEGYLARRKDHAVSNANLSKMGYRTEPEQVDHPGPASCRSGGEPRLASDSIAFLHEETPAFSPVPEAVANDSEGSKGEEESQAPRAICPRKSWPTSSRRSLAPRICTGDSRSGPSA
jgi:hypothetical protein